MTETLTGIESLDPTLEDIRMDPSQEYLQALGSLTIEDAPHEVIDVLRYAREYYKKDEDVLRLWGKLRAEATDRHTLAIIELGRFQVGHYDEAPVIPAVAYMPLVLGEGPGHAFMHDLKAVNHELEPIKDEKTSDVVAHRLIPRRMSTAT